MSNVPTLILMQLKKFQGGRTFPPKVVPKQLPVQVTVPGNSANSQGEATASGLDRDVEDTFEMELLWCIQKLQDSLGNKNLQPKQVQSIERNLNGLQNNNAPVIKKRQIMRSAFGNYREAMQKEEQNLGKSVDKVKFVGNSEKSVFLKKSKCNDENKTECESNKEKLGDVGSAFKFNFVVPET